MATQKNFPNHIGVIPDGNRRWAVKKGLKKSDGYEYGLTPGLELLKAAKKQGVRELTYYGFTMDNCKRPKEQVQAFSYACCNAVKLMEREGANICVFGNTKSPCFPASLLPYTEKRDSNDRINVNLLVNYGWDWDMKNGWLSRNIPRIDMVIRWGGMRRLSGFLPLQTVYSDFFIVDDLWPDFKEVQFENALNWYAKQDITLGG